MKFTTKDLAKLKPCADGLKWYLKNIKTEDIREILIQLNNHRPDWSRWLMVRVLSKEQNQRLAIFAARSVLHIYESKYPNDSRVRDCIESAELYLEGKIEIDELLEKRRNAAAAYADASYAAAAAVDAVAVDADASYADASYAAAAAVDAVAVDAVDADASRKEMQESIINEAIRLKGSKQ